MKNLLLVALITLCLGCTFETPVVFSEKALKDTFISVEGESIRFQQILEKYREKKILLNVWASWCGDCREALPEEQELYKAHPEVVFLHLSLDRDIDSWKAGIEKLEIEGEHYFMQSGWKGDFGKFLHLNWIPRYLIINEQGGIQLFKATLPTDKLIKQNLKK